MRTIIKITGFHPAGRQRAVGACILAALSLFAGGTALAAVTAPDFNRYQVILDKKPFGEVAPSEDASQTPQAALAEVIAKEIEMKAIVDDGVGIRIGLLDKKTNKNVSLGLGENYNGLQVVSVNYDNEEAVLKKGSETVVIKLHPDKDKDKLGPAAVAAPAIMGGDAPFRPPPPSSSPPTRRPFFADLKKRRGSPFQPVGTNVIPFQAKGADSFFKVSTGAFPQAQSPFGPFQAPQSGATPGSFQPIASTASNAPNPFAPVTPAGGQIMSPNPNIPADSRGDTIDQLLQWQTGDQLPAEGQIPAEDNAQ